MHAHSPIFPGWGKNSYRFKGKILYDGKKGKIDIARIPIAMCRHGDGYFLLGQNHFVRERFQWYASRSGAFVKIPFKSISEDLLRVEFSDHELNRLYKLWCVRRSLETGGQKGGIALWQTYVRDDPRVFFSRKWKGAAVGRVVLADLLNRVLENPDGFEPLWDTFARMLTKSGPNDDPVDIARLGSCLKVLDRERSGPILRGYQEDVRRAGIGGDERLSGIQGVIETLDKEDSERLLRLHLGEAKITDASLARLQGVAELRGLYLDGMKITDAGLAHLEGLTGLQELDLEDTRITDAGLAHLKGLTGLQKLDLTYTKITDAGLAHLKGLAGLQKLDLTYTKITDAGLAHLKGLTGLRELDVGYTQITDAGLADLKKALPKTDIQCVRSY